MGKFLRGVWLRVATVPETAPQLRYDQVWAPSGSRFVALALNIGLLTITYFAAAKLGLLLAVVHPSATAVWPPTGIALAALMIFGFEMWPGIFIGAFLVNILTAGSVMSTLGIAMGNTLEAILGAFLLIRFANGRNTLDRPQDVFRFTLLAGFTSPMVSAIFGVTSLYLAGYVAWADCRSIGSTWWLGNVGGNLILAPVLLQWAADARIRWSRRQIIEAALLLIVLCVTGYAVFGGLLPVTANTYPVAFLCITIMVLIGFSLGQRNTI
jgi:integral membrane sensor domain MASE1